MQIVGKCTAINQHLFVLRLGGIILQQNPFSLIADFDGDISALYNEEIGDVLPILPLRNMMLFPGVVAPVNVGRESSLMLVKQAYRNGGFIGVVAQRDGAIEIPHAEDLYPQGVVAKVIKVIELPDGATSVILQSYARMQVVKATRLRPFMRAKVEKLEETLPSEDDKEFEVLADACKDATIRLLRMMDSPREEAVFAIRNITHPVLLINFICTNLPFALDEKANLMKEGDLNIRALKLLSVVNKEYQYATLKQQIQNQTREDLDQQQKEYFLQQQIKNIQQELGTTQNEDVRTLQRKASLLNFSAKVLGQFEREINKLENTPQQSPDYNVIFNYLQTLVSLPWGRCSHDNLSIVKAKRQLDTDHFGLEKVKERVLEHLATLIYREDMKAPILCLVGPPGVGKTSLGRSIADALGREYVRMSLGGVHDESEIRGHRRTYIGAMPGRIVKGLIKAGCDNPVIVLDEIDKVASGGLNGDPQSALLEVLDPEQNSAFHDNYLDVDYDLSRVLFIATANSLSTISQPLLDRMEVINLEGYLTEEKIEIAKRHLIPKEQKNLNFGDRKKVKFTPSAIEFIIERYTRESGVRQLEKQISKIFRKVAYRMAMGEEQCFINKSLKNEDIETLLGKPIFSRDKYEGNQYAGVVTGLAWTAVGGEILFIESGVSKSKAPKLTLTGNLGDVMKESAMIALEYVKSHAAVWGIDYRLFDCCSVHIHVPEGATPKDGPSAGITIATSIVSAFTQRKVKENIAMTGEITLRGRVLPVGGIKEKILAAKRAGIVEVVLSKENRKDIEEIPQRYLEGLQFHFVENVNDVICIALCEEKVEQAINVNSFIEVAENNTQEVK